MRATGGSEDSKMEGKNKQVLIVVGLIVVSFIVAVVLNMSGFKSVHVEPGAGTAPPGNAGQHQPAPAH